jgi:hypothetical protein
MRSTSRSIRLAAALIIAALAATSIPAVASAGRSPDDWGWAVVRNPGRSWSEITGKNRATSTGGKVTVKRLAKGYHKVRFAGITTDTAHAQVTPLSATGDMCSYYGLGASGKPLELYVNCRNRLGVPSDVRFMISYLEAHSGGAPALAYVTAHQPKSLQYPAHPLYSYTWNNTEASVRRLGVGKYRVRLTGFGDINGNIQVTPVGQKARTCRVVKWTTMTVQTYLDIVVRCRDQYGQAAHSKFHLLFTADNGLKGNQGFSWAYAYANKARAKGKGYRPDPAYSSWYGFASAWVKRKAKGHYIVSLRSMPLGGAVQVTAVADGKYCNVSNVRKTPSPGEVQQRVEVRCFKADGSAKADVKFMLSYVK